MATRRDTRKFFSGTRTDFPKVGSDGPPVVNASGAPSSNTQMVRKPDVAAASVPQPRPGRRAARQINAQSGQALGDMTERATTASVRQAPIARAVEETQAGARTLDMYRHLFGV
jgi:hypothetical protein